MLCQFDRENHLGQSRYRKVRIGNHALQSETLMLGYGYDPALSEELAKPPVFLTSTFVFQTAEEGRDFFDYTAGRREPPNEGRSALVYSASAPLVGPFSFWRGLMIRYA